MDISGAKATGFSVVPNPNNGLISIELLSPDVLSGNPVIKLYDLLYREIKRVELVGKKQDLELYDLKSGVYYLQLLQQGKPVLIKKIIKE